MLDWRRAKARFARAMAHGGFGQLDPPRSCGGFLRAPLGLSFASLAIASITPGLSSLPGEREPFRWMGRVAD
jgi:hypothetical protein